VLVDFRERARQRIERNQADRQLRAQLRRVDTYLRGVPAQVGSSGGPIVFFNASTRIHHLSLNGAFGLVAAWAVRRAGVPAIQLVCRAGMLQCMLGTDRDHPDAPPPCRSCLRMSDDLYGLSNVHGLPFDDAVAAKVKAEVESLSLGDLAAWGTPDLPAGELCVPTLRWALRRHQLADDPTTVGLLRKYVLSAVSLAAQIEGAIERSRPRALVAFNGITYPEAVARHVARRRGIPVITHEVGLRPDSAFFSHGEATFRQIDIPPGTVLGEQQNRMLDAYLSARRQGEFTMAGVRFWPEISPLSPRLEQLVRSHRQMVSVFTNVIFDTSQVHANTVFPGMFEWLEAVEGAMLRHPETLFVLRAHPDEDRPGKQSEESVAEWVKRRGLLDRPNVVFFGPRDSVSSYELIHRSRLILVYNSSIGLEAAISGATVLCAGRARYTQVSTVFFPEDRHVYIEALEAFLTADRIDSPPEFAANARAFLFFELYRASIDLHRYLSAYPGMPGFVTLREFDPTDALRPDVPEITLLQQGILEGRPFLYPEATPLAQTEGINAG
jgi:hypothetical protein